MTATRKSKLLVWVTALALIMACAPSLVTPSVPTMDPGAVNTFIAQTVNAASTQTAASIPTLTPTPTITPTVNTPTPLPSATSTIIFILSTPTPLVLPTSTGAGTSSENYSCQVVRVSPANGTAFDPRDDFDAFWTVRNNGQKNWDRNTIDYIYASGDKIHKVSGYDLDENVRTGNSIDVGVDMQAPKNSGTYSTTWVMRAGDNEFCRLTLSIRVR